MRLSVRLSVCLPAVVTEQDWCNPVGQQELSNAQVCMHINAY